MAPRAAGAGRRAFVDYLIYVAVLAVFAAPVAGWRDLYMVDEVRYAAIVKEMIANDTWWKLTIHGAPYLDKPPLFFTLLRLYAEAFGRLDAPLLLGVVPVTGLLFMAATRFFLTAAGFDERTMRASALILIAFPATALHVNFFRMDLLFAALILAATGTFLIGLRKDGFAAATVAGGVLAAIAALVKGPLGILFPFATILVHGLATGGARRLLRADLALALATAVLPFAGWLWMVSDWLGPAAVPGLAEEQVLDRIVGRTEQSYSWWYFLAVLPIATVPWILLPLAGWTGIRADSAKRTGRRPERLVLTYFGIVFLILSAIAHKSVYYLPMMLPAVAAIAGAALIRLEAAAPRAVDRFYLASAVASVALPFIAAAAIAAMPRLEIERLSAMASPEELRPLALAFSVAALPLALAALSRGLWRIAGNLAATMILILTVKADLLPKMDDFLSAKPLISTLERKIPADEPLFLYRTFYGALLFYYDHPHHYASGEARFRRLLEDDAPPHYVMMPELTYYLTPEWRKRFKPIDRFDILLQPTLLLRSKDAVPEAD
jgi:4-amino-4-deoxy-L-arabinose transferase-like glycosyltransferase